MNVKHYILSISLFFLYSSSFSQITITSTDLMDVGDSILLANVDSIPPGFGPGSAGPDQHWDFSNLTKDTVVVLSFVDPSTTPYGSEFPLSNIAVEGMVVSGYGIEGWAYGTKTQSLFQIDGAAGSYDVLEDIVAPFDPPEVMFDFPVNYLDSLDQTTTIDIRIDSPEPAVDSIRVKVVTSVFSRVDAWGEVISPVWIGDVLRFRDVRTTIDSSWAKVLFFWVFLETNTNTGVTYKYMANNVGYPVLQFNADTSETEFSGVSYMLDAGVGETELPSISQLAFDIFPNPAHDIIYCKLNDSFEGQLIIYNMTGKQMNQQPVTSNQRQIKLDVSDYQPGMYQVVLKGEGQVYSMKKVIVY